MRKVVLAFLVIAASGCASQAGPFITNISSDGKGGLVIEKCMVSLNRMINTVEAASCTNTSIQVSK